MSVCTCVYQTSSSDRRTRGLSRANFKKEKKSIFLSLQVKPGAHGEGEEEDEDEK